jgi:hypothetical protein
MSLLSFLFGPKKPVEAGRRPVIFNLLRSNSGRLAISLGRGRGYNPGMEIQEVNKNGSASNRAPYWIKGSGSAWTCCGIADGYIETHVDGSQSFAITKIKPLPFPPEQYSQPVPFVVFVDDQGMECVNAHSAEEARSIVASDPKTRSFVRMAMSRAHFNQAWGGTVSPQPLPRTSI